MTVDVFWQRIETAIMAGGECENCPVQEYADETGDDERFCDSCGDCADGLKRLCKHLEQEAQDDGNA